MVKSKVKSQKSKVRVGEIGTIVMMVLLVMVSVIAFGSSKFLPQTITTTTKAAGGMCGSGNRFDCESEEGYGDPCLVADKVNLEFNCCVADRYDADTKEYRIRRYGCTGQYCQNTKINNALGHLVGCAGFTDADNGDSYPLNDAQTAIVFSSSVEPTQISTNINTFNGCLDFEDVNACESGCFTYGRDRTSHICTSENKCCPKRGGGVGPAPTILPSQRGLSGCISTSVQYPSKISCNFFCNNPGVGRAGWSCSQDSSTNKWSICCPPITSTITPTPTITSTPTPTITPTPTPTITSTQTLTSQNYAGTCKTIRGKVWITGYASTTTVSEDMNNGVPCADDYVRYQSGDKTIFRVCNPNGLNNVCRYLCRVGDSAVNCGGVYDANENSIIRVVNGSSYPIFITGLDLEKTYTIFPRSGHHFQTYCFDGTNFVTKADNGTCVPNVLLPGQVVSIDLRDSDYMKCEWFQKSAAKYFMSLVPPFYFALPIAMDSTLVANIFYKDVNGTDATLKLADNCLGGSSITFSLK